ncbi:iron-containing alcohol dehydrogenase [Bacteroides intestinalis]|uniref:iron-containing alcohol dehydrogenase n=1 Tax=Bacteroides intestinalis TaxID=329854 RepID=UPI0018A05FDF|nr:iron-containing alcohol dehydrogenase [Bacteroides intestinalis]
MDSFVYQYPVKQYFGKGCAEEAIKKELKTIGRNVLLAYGGGSLKRTGLYEKLRTWLEEAGKQVTDFGGIMPNPTYNKVQEGAALVRKHKIDFILAAGGGSVLDCCKIVSAQAKLEEDIWDMQYAKHLYAKEFVPMGAVVTASGTGAEQNNGAVITHEEKKLKQALFGAYYSFAVLDSDLTKTLPMKQVISGAFDTLSHCMETYMGRPQETNLSDEINEAIMRNVIKNLRSLIKNPDDDFARGELMWASAIAENGMLKLGKQTDFQCHMIEHAVGAYTDCNHGQGLAVIHPALYRHLLDSGKEKLARMAETVWRVKGTTTEETAMRGIETLEAFIREIGLPTHWSEMGITDETMLRAAADTSIIMPGCCRQFSRDEIFEILKERV